MVDSTPALVSTSVAARSVGVDRSTLWRWIERGWIQATTVTAGGHLRWNVEELRQQIQQGQLDRAVEGLPAEPAPVALAIVTSDRGVLVAQRVDGEPPWSFIGGEVAPGEHPLQAAVREVEEETGLEVQSDRVIGWREAHPQTGRFIVYVACKPITATDIQATDADEFSDVRWSSLNEAVEVMPDMYEAVREYLTGQLSS